MRQPSQNDPLNIREQIQQLTVTLDKFVKTFGTILKEANQSGIKVVIENSYPCFLLGRKATDSNYIRQQCGSIR